MPENPSYVAVPHLKEKLSWLYGWHQRIDSQAALATHLGVSAGTLSDAVNGNTKGGPDFLRPKYLQSIAGYFGIPEMLLEISDMEEFRRQLRNEPSPRAWAQLVQRASETPSIEIEAERTRGFKLLVNEPGDIPEYSVEVPVRLRAQCPGTWHLLLMLKDRTGWWCLCPSAAWPDSVIEDGFGYPPPPREFVEFDNTTGRHQVVAVLTAFPLPEPQYDALLSLGPDEVADVRDLDRLATELERRHASRAGELRLMRRTFYVAAHKDLET